MSDETRFSRSTFGVNGGRPRHVEMVGHSVNDTSQHWIQRLAQFGRVTCLVLGTHGVTQRCCSVGTRRNGCSSDSDGERKTSHPTNHHTATKRASVGVALQPVLLRLISDELECSADLEGCGVSKRVPCFVVPKTNDLARRLGQY